MHVQSNGKVRRSRAEWESIFERFSSSGLSMIAFCRHEGIAKGSFSKWMRRLRESKDEPASFVELSPTPVVSSSPALDAGELELVLPGGVRLRWKP